MRSINTFRAFFASLLLIATASAQTIRVGAAVSLQEAITEAATNYESATHQHVDFVFGSSGQLAAQIVNGAPIDLFISAANSQVDDLTKQGLVVESSRRVIAGNTLVLIVPAEATRPITKFDDLTNTDVEKVAIGQPQIVPAGQYAMQALTSLKLEQKLKDKLIYGSNVRQVLSYVERGEVAAGIVYSTDAKLSGSRVKVVATAPSSSHDPIVYPAVVIKSSRNVAGAQQFLDYLAGASAKSILTDKGFSIPTPPTSGPKP